VVLLEFWASWCLPCRKGVPFLDRIQARHERGGLRVLAVTLEEDMEAVMSFTTTHPGKFLVGRDPSGRAGEIFEVAAMPTSILLDREGRILARFEGGTELVHDRIEEVVEKVMRGETPAAAAQDKRRRGPKGNLRAWERGYLADPIMNLNGDTLTRAMREHIHSSKEAAAGDGGVAGGGCGCN
jgi:thiol-disulfide isomerase/thioredoxin